MISLTTRQLSVTNNILLFSDYLWSSTDTLAEWQKFYISKDMMKAALAIAQSQTPEALHTYSTYIENLFKTCLKQKRKGTINEVIGCGFTYLGTEDATDFYVCKYTHQDRTSNRVEVKVNLWSWGVRQRKDLTLDEADIPFITAILTELG